MVDDASEERTAGGVSSAGDLESVYGHRFADKDAAAKDALWAEICQYLQRYVDSALPVLDVACDRGDFIRHIRTSERWAVDVRDVRRWLPADVRFHQSDGPSMASVLPAAHFGTVFMSNYLEHLPSAEVILRQLRAAWTVCRPGGRIIILQPNIRLVGPAYWDFLDHHKALTERSLREAAEASGFVTERVLTRFLPFTTKSRLPQRPSLVRWYLRMPFVWILMGKQTLYVGRKVAAAPEALA